MHLRYQSRSARTATVLLAVAELATAAVVSAQTCLPTDHFADRCRLEAASLTAPLPPSEATAEVGEPSHLEDATGRSLWVEWAAPRAGELIVTTLAESLPPRIRLYTGTTLPALEPISASESRLTPEQQPAEQARISVTAGTVIQIALVYSEDTPTPFEWTLQLAPPNDSFANRTEIPVDAALIVEGHNEFATVEPDEPSHVRAQNPAATGLNTVWWTFTAPPESTKIRITVTDYEFSSNRPPQLAVYQGDGFTEGLTPIASNFSGAKNPFTFPVTGGSAYHLAVDSLKPFGLDPPFSVPHQYGSFQFRIQEGLEVANDDYTNPLPIAVGPNSEFTSAIDATSQGAFEPQVFLPTSGSSLWWSFAPPAGAPTMCYTITAEGRQSDGPPFAPLIGLFEFPVQGATEALAMGQGAYTFCPDPEQDQYAILLDSHPWLNPEAYRIEINPAVPPPNDEWTSPAVLTAGSPVSESNLTATVTDGEPIHSGFAGERSLWWQWNSADEPLTASINTSGSDAPHQVLLSVFLLNPEGELQRVAENLPIPDPDIPGAYPNMASVTSFLPLANQSYLIRAASAAPPTLAGNTLQFELEQIPAPENDHWLQATPLTTTTLTGTNRGATAEPSEPNHGAAPPAHSIWWQWQAPTHGRVTLTPSAIENEFQSRLAVYRRPEVAPQFSTLTAIARNGTPERGYSDTLVFPSVEGTTYLIAVDSRDGSVGRTRIDLDFVPGYRLATPTSTSDSLEFEVLGNPDFVSRFFQIESSRDLISWTPLEGVLELVANRAFFTAPQTESAQYFRVVGTAE